jgi:exopolysaccharide biosynthesis polyprenyl glycosylphosphotransferase
VVGYLTSRGCENLSDESRAKFEELRGDLPVLGSMDDIAELSEKHGIHEVIVTDPDLSPQTTVAFLLECEKICLKASVVPNILEMVVTDVHLDEIGGLPLLGLSGSRLRGGNIALKRVFDIGVAAAMLLALSPIMLAIAIAVKISSRGPVFYRQERVTLYGTSFRMLKFRSMRLDAEDASGPVWAREQDPRTTKLGAFLRRWNLDELPQLINVLLGEMSLVGPRPERPYFVEQFKDEIPHYMARLHVKAGITGWAQVNGLRGNTSLSERIKYDLFYVENWSIWFDVKILVMTLTARENAY